MTDTVIKMGRSVVQHGPLNDRVYLMAPHAADMPWIVDQLYDLAHTKGYAKILARIQASMARIFEDAGYVKEAKIPDYFGSGEGLVFVSRFLTRSRSREIHPARVSQYFSFINNAPNHPPHHASGFPPIRVCNRSDTEEMAGIFRQVFASYPFPVGDPEYLAHTMETHTRYYCVTENGRIVGICGGEMDMDHLAVEMTDFAVISEMRGRGLAVYLLTEMERDMYLRGMKTAYTIARTLSPGINITFKRMNYEWGGTLVNNTQISGGIESMWVWHKRLAK